MRPVRQRFTLALILIMALTLAGPAPAAEFTFSSITSASGGPGRGTMPSLNNGGDVAFVVDDSVFTYRRSQGVFTNLMTLPGAPSRGWHPRLADNGDLAFIDPGDRHVWLFHSAAGTFTDLATLPGFPGVSQLHGLYGAFDFNNNGNLALHAGDLNFGDIYFYEQSSGSFTRLTGLAGAANWGRDCRINDSDQVAYTGGADIYLYNRSDGTTLNITDLPGGPGSGLPGAMLNNVGDIAISSGSELIRFTTATATFWYLSTLPGYPASVGSVDRNDLGDDGAISFWADEIYYFDPGDSTFTQLTNQGVVPFPGHESKLNRNHMVAFEAGAGVWLGELVASPVGPRAASSLHLAQNQPNPFNPQTRIFYDVPVGGGSIRLDILDVRGHRVRTLVAEYQAAGSRTVTWDGRDEGGRSVASGTYLYRLRTDDGAVARAMQLVR